MREKKELAGNFEMRDLGEARWFLTMEITHDQVAHMITIDQRQYIWKILEHFRLENVQSVTTLMAIVSIGEQFLPNTNIHHRGD